MSYDICIGFNLVNNTNVNILFTFVKITYRTASILFTSHTDYICGITFSYISFYLSIFY